MRTLTFIVVILISIAGLEQAVARHTLPATAPAAGPMPLPTMQDLKDMFEQADYRTCLQQIARVMRLSPAKQAGYDLDQLQLLRGQSMICTGDPRSAKRWLTEATHSEQPEVVIHARGLLALIERSKGTIYTPRTGDRTPIDFMDPARQTQALNALMNDEIESMQEKSRVALDADNLAPTMALAPTLLELHAAERVATGKNERTGPIAKAIGEHARDLMSRELTTQDQRISGIEQMADQIYTTRGAARTGRRGWWWNTGVTRRGLTSEERGNLDELIDYLKKIQDTATNAQRMARNIGGNVDAWDAVITRAAQVRAHAQSVLDAEGIKTGSD